MRTARLLLTLVLLGAGAAKARAEHLYESERLRISGDVDEAWIEQAAGLGRALFVALTNHFGRAPGAAELPLRLVLHPDRGHYEKALTAQGIRGNASHAGGWTIWKTGVSHVWVQAEPFDTRRLILHELFHQFHDKCRPASRRGQGPWWYREGLAEWFGWHRRTERGVQFGALDAVALNALARRAALRATARDFDPWAVALGRTKNTYVDALALVGGLMLSKDDDLRARFRRWERGMLEKGGGSKAFERRFRERRRDLARAIRLGWRSLGGQWQPAEAGWDEDEGVIAVPRSAHARLWRVRALPARPLVRRVEIVTGTEPAAAAGLVLGLGSKRVVRVSVHANGVRLESMPFGDPPEESTREAALPEGRKTILEVRVKETGVEVRATRAGRRVSLGLAQPDASVHQWGLFVQATGARFRFLPEDLWPK